jgi:metallophosphoesterase (TIGR00282 family)
MRIAVLGDVVGTPGRMALGPAVARLREHHGADLVIANVENMANGSGLTPEGYRKAKAAGVDGMTLGDHAFKKMQIASVLRTEADIIRPLNLPAAAPGRGVMSLTCHPAGGGGAVNVHVVTVLGRLFISSPLAGDPFAAIERALAQLPGGGERSVVLVEVHAEATSEKQAIGWAFNGRVSCVYGTHTHVPTADARVLPGPGSGPSIPARGDAVFAGTAYVSDLGMTGPIDSVLGRRADRVLSQMIDATPKPFDVADGPVAAQGVLIEVDERTGRARGIERVDWVVESGD